jgi:hypothetical protein
LLVASALLVCADTAVVSSTCELGFLLHHPVSVVLSSAHSVDSRCHILEITKAMLTEAPLELM